MNYLSMSVVAVVLQWLLGVCAFIVMFAGLLWGVNGCGRHMTPKADLLCKRVMVITGLAGVYTLSAFLVISILHQGIVLHGAIFALASVCYAFLFGILAACLIGMHRTYRQISKKVQNCYVG